MTSGLQDLADNMNNFNLPAQHLTLSKSSKSATTKSNFWWDPPHALGLNFLREYLLPFALFGKESWYSGQAAQRISFFDKFQSFLWFLHTWNINAKKNYPWIKLKTILTVTDWIFSFFSDDWLWFFMSFDKSDLYWKRRNVGFQADSKRQFQFETESLKLWNHNS